MSFQIHCHHCKQWLGEASQPMRLVGMFEAPRDREQVEAPRDTWHCKRCGWVSVFRVASADAQHRSWRAVELKSG